jgi:hypothetical protein
LCSRIPFYRLPLVLRDHPDLDGIGRLTLLQSLGCVRLVLWDEDRQRLVSFREARPKGKRGPEREAHLISMVESWLHLAVQADRIQAVMDHSRPIIPRNLNLDNS